MRNRDKFYNQKTIRPRKKSATHYVDNERFLADIIDYKAKCLIAKEDGKEKPRLSEYIGKCIYLITENLGRKPRFVNYSFLDEMKSDAIENCFLYFDNFDPAISRNPFSYFTQIIYFAFHRRINREEKNRYCIYKSFQESCSGIDDNLMVDDDGKHLTSPLIYDNINEFIGRFEKRMEEHKLKRKQAKEGLEKFVEEDDEGRKVRDTVSSTDLD